MRLDLELPAGAVVEIGVSETLEHGRVSPFINTAAGHSCNLDRYVARGGEQTFFPKTPKGGRFLEVQVVAEPAAVRWRRARFFERVYLPEETAGAFTCGDERLDRIWSVGWETLRSCAEDVISDNPTREHGQWIGDALSVGIEINAAGSGDLRLVKRSLRTAPHCVDAEGRIPGLFPGIREYLPTYGFAWTGANLRYQQLTGDDALLHELFPVAVRNLVAYLPHLGERGLGSVPGTWTFVDWGYLTETKPFATGEDREQKDDVDFGLTLFFLEALRDLERWARRIGREAEVAELNAVADRLTGSVGRHVVDTLRAGGLEAVGYHVAVLAIRCGLVPAGDLRACLGFLKDHIRGCFPLNADAPRLADTSVMEHRLLTPSFCHFALPVLIEHGEMGFVLDVYREAWGWMLGGGRTTWCEAFDTRWTHCHQWAGCPTWQLTRYGLGLQHRFDRALDTFSLCLQPGTLVRASGALPIDERGDVIRVDWAREGDTIRFGVDPDRPVRLLAGGVNGEALEIQPGPQRLDLRERGGAWTLTGSGSIRRRRAP